MQYKVCALSAAPPVSPLEEGFDWPVWQQRPMETKMTKKMLIDSTHDEETRVAVVDGRKLVEFDYESKFRKPLKGSIFLAKVTRVEPSL